MKNCCMAKKLNRFYVTPIQEGIVLVALGRICGHPHENFNIKKWSNTCVRHCSRGCLKSSTNRASFVPLITEVWSASVAATFLVITDLLQKNW